MQLTLFQPDIPQNAGTLIRLCACFDVKINIIEPCGFAFSSSKLKRSGMDYVDHARIEKFDCFESYLSSLSGNDRLILLTTKAQKMYLNFEFSSHDHLMLGQESQGVPKEVFDQVQDRVKIPMKSPMRSLNVAISGAIVLSEALRQTDQLSF